jgi:membrane protein implicated in regulation of membrane protease activity
MRSHLSLPVVSLDTTEGTMRALAWIGIAILALAVLAWFVFKITLWFAALLFAIGVVLLVLGFAKVERAV